MNEIEGPMSLCVNGDEGGRGSVTLMICEGASNDGERA